MPIAVKHQHTVLHAQALLEDFPMHSKRSTLKHFLNATFFRCVGLQIAGQIVVGGKT